MPLLVQCLHFACICPQRKPCADCTSFVMQFDNHQLWPFTKINITCDPRPQLAHSKAGPPAETRCFFGGEGGGAFVMLIIWPNLNDPDICCPTCVKPRIQFVPAIHKAGMTLEAVKCLCVYCMCVRVCMWGRNACFFFFYLCTYYSSNYQ